MYRHEESGTSYDIRVKGQETDDAVKELLDGLVLKLEDEGNKDAPWPWEGEPLEPVLAEQMVGSYTIVPEYIPFKEAQGVMQIMEHQFVKQGDQVFHLLGNKLDTYNYSESGLEFVSTMELDKFIFGIFPINFVLPCKVSSFFLCNIFRNICFSCSRCSC